MVDLGAPDQKLYQNLFNRTFIGFLIAAFLAAFNDQCIHAAAMFFAIRTETLTPGAAISLMPILFFLPWALFCTLAAYLSDRYSKRTMMIIWKLSEVVIALIALFGFWLGTHPPFEGAEHFGAWAVLACVFLMGSHSAFYVPNKYGVLPEIFPTHLLARANGLVESASFLAIIIGTASGGILSDEKFFKGREYVIGYFLVATSIIGSLCSLLILPMKPANPNRPFPGWNPLKLYAPLWQDLKMLFSLRSRRTALWSIAFFTFMTVYMRGVMYMHGESQNPIWSELETSLVVATVALGIGVGSPLAGFLSGGKLELGMVTFGTLGLAVFSALGAVFVLMHSHTGDIGLIVSLICIGFFSGFYVLPMYTMLQFRAPKGGKGATIAASNFLNVAGAILASFMFWMLQNAMHGAGLAPAVPVDETPVKGVLTRLKPPGSIEVEAIQIDDQHHVTSEGLKPGPLPDPYHPHHDHDQAAKALIVRGKGVIVGKPIELSTYKIRSKSTGKDTHYYHIRPEGTPKPRVYDNQDIPAYLFAGGTVLSLIVLVLLVGQLPDLFARTGIWLKSLFNYMTSIVNSKYLPATGPVLLVTNGHTSQELGDIHACCDRLVQILPGTPASRDSDRKRAEHALQHDELLLMSILAPEIADRLHALRTLEPNLTILPVYHSQSHSSRRVKVVLHEALPATASPEEIRQALLQTM
jgi:MFS family permease